MEYLRHSKCMSYTAPPPHARHKRARTNALLETAPKGLVDLPGKVGGAEHSDQQRPAALIGRRGAADAVHLNKKLRFHATTRLVLSRTAARTAQRVDLIDENGRRRIKARHCKQHLNLHVSR